MRVLTCLLLAVAAAAAQDRDTKVRNDRADFKDDDGWIYNDLDKGLALARKTGKPLLVTIRCIP
jgi:hypothetical protein